MIFPRPTYGSAFKQAIMDNDVWFLENMVVPFNENLYNPIHNACDNCDINALKELIRQGADMTHPYFCQPDCFILNPINIGPDYQTIKTFLEYIITSCIDVNAVAREVFYCMHASEYTYRTKSYVRNHPSFKSVPTLLDVVEIEIASGELDPSYGKFLLKLLRDNGAKSGVELGYTYKQGKRLCEYFKYKGNRNIIGYNYDYMKKSKEAIHLDLITTIIISDNSFSISL